jgi:hypothetical protein
MVIHLKDKHGATINVQNFACISKVYFEKKKYGARK